MSVNRSPGEVVRLAEHHHGGRFWRVAQGVFQMVEIEAETELSCLWQKMSRHPVGAGGTQVMFRGGHRNKRLLDTQSGRQQVKQFG